MTLAPSSSPKRDRIRRDRRRAWSLGAAILALLAVATAASIAFPELAPFAALAALPFAWILFALARRYARRARIRARGAPAELRAIVAGNIAFYGALEPGEAQRFLEELEIFVVEKRITGVGTTVDDTCRVLVAASAVIPVFGLPGWEWENVNEVLVYPDAFTTDWRGRGDGARASGVVGDQELRRTMILAKSHLIDGFRRARDGHNVGVHEFAHLVDWMDGSVDGVPKKLLGSTAAHGWAELVRKEMQAIAERRSSLRAYAGTNPAEFFAVASESFFEDPVRLREKHPELYAVLERIYRQSTHTLTFAKIQSVLSRSRFRRNEACPCGSGAKYKRCCRAGGSRIAQR
ncbi:MAG: zinc-dependent peptidase [Planctomycetota bacterium]